MSIENVPASNNESLNEEEKLPKPGEAFLQLPEKVRTEIKQLREEARKFNEGIEIEGTRYKQFLVRLEAFNMRLDGFFKDLHG